MITNSNSLIDREVDRLFSKIVAPHGQCGNNPITGDGFVWGLDPIATQKKEAAVALLAHEWFAVNGPPDAPALPLTSIDVEDYRTARGLKGIVGFYARSLSRDGYDRQAYDVCNHPSFNDFACGLMAINTGDWGIEKDEDLKKRFPPRPLEGMTPSAYWAPPEEYAEYIANYERIRLREARLLAAAATHH
jgi:hypothetical protein